MLLTNSRTKEARVTRVDISISNIDGVNFKQICKKSRVIHNLDLSREFSIPYKPNTDADPCYKCRDNTDPGCLRCFKPFGERGRTQEEKQNFFALKDNHGCLMTALEKLAAQDTPKITAIHLATYVPLVPAGYKFNERQTL